MGSIKFICDLRESRMPSKKMRLTIISLLISFTLAGAGTQIGLVIQPMAAYFSEPITLVSAQFSWYLGGVLLGNLISFAVFRYLKIRTVIIFCYALVFGLSLVLNFASDIAFVPIYLCLLGAAYGVGVCASSTIITAIWSE